MTPRNAHGLICWGSLLVAVWFIRPAVAQNITIPSGVTVTTTQKITADNESVTVETGGAIDTVTGGGKAIEATANNQTVTNRGTINSGDTGIRSNGDDARIENSGAIKAENYGIRSEGARAIINNSGTVHSIEHGIRSDGDFVVITNTGTVNGNSQGTVVQIHGIRLGGQSATVANHGTIIAEEDGIFSISDNALIVNHGTTRGGVAGIGSQGDNSTVINAGRAISGDGSGSIKLSGINDQLILLNGSVLEGIVRFDGINQGLTVGPNLNLYLQYGGAISKLHSVSPLVHDASKSLVVAVDPTGFATAGSWLNTVSGAVQDAVYGNTKSRTGQTSASSNFAYGIGDLSAARGWASTYGGHQTQSGIGGVTGAHQAYGGIITGANLVRGERLFGVFGGGGFSAFETDGNQQSIDVSSVYGGLFGSGLYGDWRVQAAFTAGYAHHSSHRQVANNLVAGGLETASATYGGTFVSPSLVATRPIGERLSLSIAGSYSALFLDGYEENGSAANLTVAGRTVQLGTLRARATRIAARQALETGTLSIETWLGVDGTFNLGGKAVHASVAGLPLEFSAAFADASAIGSAGIALTHSPVSGSWLIEASLKGRLGTHSYQEIRATARMGRRF